MLVLLTGPRTRRVLVNYQPTWAAAARLSRRIQAAVSIRPASRCG